MHLNYQAPTSIIELELVLHQKQIVITFLKANHKFKLKNFKAYREDRTTHGGGLWKVENVSIIVTINNRQIRITSVYCANYTNAFLNDINILTTPTTDYFIFWGLIAHYPNWNCFQINTAGNKLFNHQMSSHYYMYSSNSKLVLVGR